jgi:arylsulfatase A-like enzyme
VLDTEIGRLLAALSPETWETTAIIFVADNGTAECDVTPPFSRERAKLPVYQGGVWVPRSRATAE